MSRLSKLISIVSVLLGAIILVFAKDISHLLLSVLGAPLTLIYFLVYLILNISLPHYVIYILFFAQYQLIAYLFDKNKTHASFAFRTIVVLVISMAIACYLYMTYSIR